MLHNQHPEPNALPSHHTLSCFNATHLISPATDKERLKSLADVVLVLVDTMVKQSEQKLSDSASTLQAILAAAADQNGEWFMPLTPQQVGGNCGGVGFWYWGVYRF